MPATEIDEEPSVEEPRIYERAVNKRFRRHYQRGARSRLEGLRPWSTLAYAGMLSLGITEVALFLTFLSDVPSISPADVNGCSLPRAYGFPVPFVFYNSPFTQNQCHGYVISVGLGGLVIDLLAWLAIAFFFLLAVSRLRTTGSPSPSTKREDSA